MSLSNKNIEEPYCKEKPPYQRYKVSQSSWEEGYKCYLNDKRWCYDFEHELSRGDCEQSFLSQMIFGHLLKIHGYKDFSVNRNYICVKGNDNNIYFHFDVMNNPKIYNRNGKIIDKKRLGAIACDNLRKEWESLYHTIGNFTLIPWAEDLQKKHNKLHERWDDLLKYCQEKWDTWDRNKIDISFEEYIKLTYQHLYFEDILCDFINQYDNKLDKITPKKWEKLVRRWNEKIDNGECKKIVTFKGDIKDIVKKINFLIEARGRCIILILRQEF